jgi:hypothetical protein
MFAWMVSVIGWVIGLSPFIKSIYLRFGAWLMGAV